MIDLTPFGISLRLAFTVTAILFILSFPLAWLLATKKFRFKTVVETLITMPMVLPPTVIGFYLLLAFSPRYGLGKFLSDHAGIQFVFSFAGLVLASVIHALPFMVQPLKNGFQSIDRSIVEASWTLGKSKLETLVRVILPNMLNFIITGIVMTFIHVMGEFGVILMVGGSIPGVTKVASIEIYERAERMDIAGANTYALILVLLSFSVLVALSLLNRNLKPEAEK